MITGIKILFLINLALLWYYCLLPYIKEKIMYYHMIHTFRKLKKRYKDDVELQQQLDELIEKAKQLSDNVKIFGDDN